VDIGDVSCVNVSKCQGRGDGREIDCYHEEGSRTIGAWMIWPMVGIGRKVADHFI
jgi:hypothetical protein